MKRQYCNDEYEAHDLGGCCADSRIVAECWTCAIPDIRYPGQGHQSWRGRYHDPTRPPLPLTADKTGYHADHDVRLICVEGAEND